MARALRILIPGAWYHVVARGIAKRRIFYGEQDFQHFEQLLGTLPERFGVHVQGYVMMANHYHLQLETPRENLSEAVRWLNVSYAIWLNRKRGRVGPLFQGRFKAIVHDPTENGLTIHEYIHLNPMRVRRFAAGRGEREGPNSTQLHEMEKELKEYRWSSYRAYAGLAAKPKWLTTGKIMDMIPGRGAKQKEKNYQKRIAQMIGTRDLGTNWKDYIRAGIALGSERFADRVKEIVEGDRNEQREVRLLKRASVSWPDIIAAIEKEWKEPWEQVNARHGDPGRDIAMLAARRFGGMSLREIGEAVGGVKYPAVSDAIRRMIAKLDRKERALQARYGALLKILNL
jgi:putative transposase